MCRFIISIALIFISFTTNSESISIVTNKWEPYINGKHENYGTAAELLNQIMSQKKIKINWHYQNYDLAFNLLAQGQHEAGFPYFKTEQRENKVLFSRAVFWVTNRIYYNRQRKKNLDLKNIKKHRFGKVSGYSYGQNIDNLISTTVTYPNEQQALESLLKNEIDFLPMTESVMNKMLNTTYKDQALLIQHIERIKESDSMHLIAPKNKNGEKLIKNINHLLEEAYNIPSLKIKPVKRYTPKDIAILNLVEGYPMITGQTSLDNPTQFYTLPKGTKVLVIKWSEKILTPSTNDRIYKNMMASSLVVILNGPHVGKELYIKNMHLEIKQ